MVIDGETQICRSGQCGNLRRAEPNRALAQPLIDSGKTKLVRLRCGYGAGRTTGDMPREQGWRWRFKSLF
ncbi:hypothetical protein ACLK1T_16835 [Escherichia coli]